MTASSPAELHSRCDLLRSLHRPGAPLLLPNAWDVPTARAVVAAGFPVVATTSALRRRDARLRRPRGRAG